MVLPFVCRQIRSETLNLYPSILSLEGQLSDVYAFIERRSILVQHLRSIFFDLPVSISTMWRKHDFTLFDALNIVRHLKDLEKLTIRCSSPRDGVLNRRLLKNKLIDMFGLDRPGLDVEVAGHINFDEPMPDVASWVFPSGRLQSIRPPPVSRSSDSM